MAAGRVQSAAAGGRSMPDGSSGLRVAAGRTGVVNLPNAITLARLCAVPAAVWLVLHDDFPAAFWLFVAAGASDAVDGWLARRYGPTAVGTVLDPVADKLLLVSMYVTLAAVRELPDWLAILVVFRDLLIVGGVLVLGLSGQKVAIHPLLVSKLNTVLQIVLVALVLAMAATGWKWPVITEALSWVVAASTFASGAAYVWVGVRPR
jgi:cardiolipin synthase